MKYKLLLIVLDCQLTFSIKNKARCFELNSVLIIYTVYIDILFPTFYKINTSEN